MDSSRTRYANSMTNAIRRREGGVFFSNLLPMNIDSRLERVLSFQKARHHRIVSAIGRTRFPPQSLTRGRPTRW